MKNLNTMHAERIIDNLNDEMIRIDRKLSEVIEWIKNDEIRPCAARKIYAANIARVKRYCNIASKIEAKYNIDKFFGLESFEDIIRFFE